MDGQTGRPATQLDCWHCNTAGLLALQHSWLVGTAGNPGIVVAVVDTGVDYTHPDLAGIIWKNRGEIPGNKVDDDKNGGWVCVLKTTTA